MESTGEATDQYVLASASLPSTSDFSVKVGLNFALGLNASSYGQKTVGWRPACCWLTRGSTSTSDLKKPLVNRGLKNYALFDLKIFPRIFSVGEIGGRYYKTFLT